MGYSNKDQRRKLQQQRTVRQGNTGQNEMYDLSHIRLDCTDGSDFSLKISTIFT